MAHSADCRCGVPGSVQGQCVCVSTMMDKVALNQVFLQVLIVFPISNIPPMLHIYLRLDNTNIRRTSGRTLETIKQSNTLSYIWQ
jgi:hypothetical protein